MAGKRRSVFGYDPNAGQGRDLQKPQDGASLTVSQVTALVRQKLERDFSQIAVRGELSNVVVAASGHLYVNLKDDKSQISMVMWRAQRNRLSFDVQDGVAVVVTGRLSLYEPRGSFQLIASSMIAEGTGDLEAQFRALKARYEERGWFDQEHKKKLPFLPQTIGVVTSSAGAAIHDILQTIQSRFARAHVILKPVRVQGMGAATEIAQAIDQFCAQKNCDVLIVGRGGGSIEDLWAFNEAEVVEAIFRADIPIISAVGHETDVTLADLVADHRALTPTAAAEIVVPVLLDLEAKLADCSQRMQRLMKTRVARARADLNSLSRSWALREPLNYLRRVEQRLDEIGRNIARICAERLQGASRRLSGVGESPGRHGLLRRLEHAKEKLDLTRDRLDSHLQETLRCTQLELEQQRRLLMGLSPLAVLDRGYSLSRRADGTIIRDASLLEPGEIITTRFATGGADSQVTDIQG